MKIQNQKAEFLLLNFSDLLLGLICVFPFSFAVWSVIVSDVRVSGTCFDLSLCFYSRF